MKKDLESFMYQLRIKAQVEVIEMVSRNYISNVLDEDFFHSLDQH